VQENMLPQGVWEITAGQPSSSTPPVAAGAVGEQQRKTTMKLQRIEKSKFKHGEYVGYCRGAQRIKRGGLGWKTYSIGSISGNEVYATAWTLEELDSKLQQIEG
jgi:hypothetical protein